MQLRQRLRCEARAQVKPVRVLGRQVLEEPQLLQPDEALVSPDGRYSFALRSSGRLELWSGEEPAVSDSEALAAAFRLFDDGRARFLPSIPAELPQAGAWVSLRDDGALTLLDEAGSELWRSSAATGQEGAQ